MMGKFARDPENGMLIAPDGCHYENEHQVHHYAVLGLCGCGDPEAAYNFCRDVLKVFDRRDRSKEWINAEKAIAELVVKEPETAAHVLAHLLTDRDVIEHGGSVGGSWLTQKGEAIVDLPPADEDSI